MYQLEKKKFYFVYRSQTGVIQNVIHISRKNMIFQESENYHLNCECPTKFSNMAVILIGADTSHLEVDHVSRSRIDLMKGERSLNNKSQN